MEEFYKHSCNTLFPHHLFSLQQSEQKLIPNYYIETVGVLVWSLSGFTSHIIIIIIIIYSSNIMKE